LRDLKSGFLLQYIVGSSVLSYSIFGRIMDSNIVVRFIDLLRLFFLLCQFIDQRQLERQSLFSMIMRSRKLVIHPNHLVVAQPLKQILDSLRPQFQQVLLVAASRENQAHSVDELVGCGFGHNSEKPRFEDGKTAGCCGWPLPSVCLGSLHRICLRRGGVERWGRRGCEELLGVWGVALHFGAFAAHTGLGILIFRGLLEKSLRCDVIDGRLVGVCAQSCFVLSHFRLRSHSRPPKRKKTLKGLCTVPIINPTPATDGINN